MIYIIIIILLLLIKRRLLIIIYNLLEKSIIDAKIIYYYIRSLNEKKAGVFLYNELNDFFNIIIFSLIANFIGGSILGYTYLGIILGVIMSFYKIAKIIKAVDTAKSELLEELNKFLFIYEMEQITGSNLFNAINTSVREISYIEIKTTVDEYITEFEKLFKLTKWVVIKRIIILIEQNKNFTSRELGLSFLNVSDELSKKYYERKKLELEKKENLMLLPMSINLVLMILYLLSPFIFNFL